MCVLTTYFKKCINTLTMYNLLTSENSQNFTLYIYATALMKSILKAIYQHEYRKETVQNFIQLYHNEFLFILLTTFNI